MLTAFAGLDNAVLLANGLPVGGLAGNPFDGPATWPNLVSTVMGAAHSTLLICALHMDKCLQPLRGWAVLLFPGLPVGSWQASPRCLVEPMCSRHCNSLVCRVGQGQQQCVLCAPLASLSYVLSMYPQPWCADITCSGGDAGA